MNNILEFFIKMRDLTAPAIAKTVQNVQRIEKTAKLSERSLQGVTDRVRNLGASDPSAGPVRGLQNIQREADKTKAKVNELSNSVTGTSSSKNSGGIMALGKKLMPYIGAAAMLSFGSSSVNAAMDFGAQQKSYEVLTGSKGRGKELAGELRELKQNTIMGAAVYKNAQTMLGFGISDKEVIKDLKMLGDISMGDADKLGSLTLAFSQTRAAGRLMGQDLLQYINAGFNPLYDISQMTGKSMGVLRKEMEAGAISADMVTKAFEHATGKGGKFNNMMNEIAETPFGKKQMLKGQFAAFKIDLGEALMPMAEGVMNLGSKVLDWINPHKKLSQTLIAEKAETDSLIKSITNLNEGNDQRKAMLNYLVSKYPDLLGNIDKEKITNGELLSKLNEINTAYQKRIDIAASGELVEALRKQIKEADAIFMESSVYGQLMKDGGFKNLEKVDPMAAYFGKTFFGEKGYTKILNDAAAKQKGIGDDARNQLVKQERHTEVLKGVKTAEDLFNKIQGGDKSIPKQLAEEVRRIMPDVQLFRQSYGTMNNFRDYDFSKLSASDIKAGAGLTPGGGGGGKGGGGSVANGITGGGPRVININGVNMKLADTMNVTASDGKDFLNQVEPKLEEFFLRVLNSGASVQ